MIKIETKSSPLLFTRYFIADFLRSVVLFPVIYYRDGLKLVAEKVRSQIFRSKEYFQIGSEGRRFRLISLIRVFAFSFSVLILGSLFVLYGVLPFLLLYLLFH